MIHRSSCFLITGGTGSLGQKIARHLLNCYDPRTVRIYSRGEYLQSEMAREFNDDRLRFLIGDIRDYDRLSFALRDVDYVIHTAALKQVGACDYNPMEAVKTNVDGSNNVIQSSIERGIKKVLAISSDKAVHPVNLYGMTKGIMEKSMLNSNHISQTGFSCVRFGNFYGSKGSVLPLWEKQAKSGVITITDGDMSRYWISLERAADFTCRCLLEMDGGEIFIPYMHNERIQDLEESLYPECRVEYIGKGKDEKLHEELFADTETPENIGWCWRIK